MAWRHPRKILIGSERGMSLCVEWLYWHHLLSVMLVEVLECGQHLQGHFHLWEPDSPRRAGISPVRLLPLKQRS